MHNKVLLSIFIILIGINVMLYKALDIIKLKTEVAIVKHELEEHDKLSKKIQYIESLYDTLQLPNVNKPFYQSVLNSEIVDITDRRVSDSISERKFNNEVANTLVTINQLFQENEKLQEELSESEEYIEQKYRRIIMQLAKKHQRD